MPKPRLPRDSVLVSIPISITADMGVAIRRTRVKRVSQLKSFMKPAEMNGLQQDSATSINTASNDPDLDEMDVDVEKKFASKSKMESTIPKRDGYSSMLDYLEAKYVKGVVVQETGLSDKGGVEDEAIMSDSEASGSCYSNANDSGNNFIDDSDLKLDLVQQVVASSSFGKTKLEAEARRSKNSNTDRHVEGIIDDDGAYFVNLGKLEMEDGWDDKALMDKGDSSKRKSVKRKRPSSAQQEGTKKLMVSTKKHSANQNVPNKKASIHPTKVSKSTTVERKKLSLDLNTASVKSKIIEKKSETAVDKKVLKEMSSPVSVTPKIKDGLNAKRKEADAKVKELAKQVQRLYDKCVAAIKTVPEDLWPRKKKKLVKVTIKVPQGKKSGESILFSNPHIAGQKLKVQIPEKLTGDTFNVSVPMNEQSSDEQVNNKIPKDLVSALYEYSCVYDEWTQATALHRSLLPMSESNNLGPYKVGTERLKKYDVLVGEFPQDLVTPMEIPYLRSVVRNEVKRRHKLGIIAPTVTCTKLFYPDKGTHFTFIYNDEDFI